MPGAGMGLNGREKNKTKKQSFLKKQNNFISFPRRVIFKKLLYTDLEVPHHQQDPFNNLTCLSHPSLLSHIDPHTYTL